MPSTRRASAPSRRAFRRGAVGLALALAACGDGAAPVAPDTSRPELAIADGANGGTPGFYFLPPLVPAPSFGGTFDGALPPEVRICQLTGGVCGQEIVRFDGATSPRIAVDATGEAYAVTWATKRYALSTTATYRIRVAVGAIVLGTADVRVVSSAKALGTVPSGFVGVVRGKDLSIRFRIETGIVAGVVVLPPDTVLTAGSTRPYTAIVTGLSGDQVPGAPVTWSSGDAAIATIDAAGIATGVGTGTTIIVGTSGGVSDTASLAVVVPPPPPPPPEALVCVKPFVLPDLWLETSGAQDLDGDHVWETGEGWIYEPEAGDGYQPFDYAAPLDPAATGYGSALRDGAGITGDRGRALLVRPQSPSSPATANFYYPWQLPGAGGSAEYVANITSCNPATIELGVPYPLLLGNQVGPTVQGTQQVIALDPAATWQGDQVVGSVFTDWRESPRVIKVMLFDPAQTGAIAGGVTTVSFVRSARVFLEGVSRTTGTLQLRFIEIVP